MYLFEWAVHIHGRAVIAPAGVARKELRARRRLLETLHDEVPAGTGASGWLTLIGLPPLTDRYERYQTLLILDRRPDGHIERVHGSDKPLDPLLLPPHACWRLLQGVPRC